MWLAIESDWSKSLLMLTSRREVLIGKHCLDCVLRPVDVGSLLLFICASWAGGVRPGGFGGEDGLVLLGYFR